MPMPVKFIKTEIPGVLIVDTGIIHDRRGFFYELYAQKMWADAGFTESFVQDNVSLSARGTMRGLHYQLAPHDMGKLIRVMWGAIFDVAVDLRRGSPTFGRYVSRTLRADKGEAFWVPTGMAHGFVALEDNTVVSYKCTRTHVPEAERSLAYNDPSVGIEWPLEPTLMSPKDAAAPTLDSAEFNFEYVQ